MLKKKLKGRKSSKVNILIFVMYLCGQRNFLSTDVCQKKINIFGSLQQRCNGMHFFPSLSEAHMDSHSFQESVSAPLQRCSCTQLLVRWLLHKVTFKNIASAFKPLNFCMHKSEQVTILISD